MFNDSFCAGRTFLVIGGDLAGKHNRPLKTLNMSTKARARLQIYVHKPNLKTASYKKSGMIATKINKIFKIKSNVKIILKNKQDNNKIK